MWRFICWLLSLDECWHDWQCVEHSSRQQVEYEVDCHRAGGRLPACSQTRDRGNYLYHRVCLKCDRVENTIAAYKTEYILKKQHDDARMQKARKIAELYHD